MLKSLPEELDVLDITQQRKMAEIMQNNVNQFLGIFQSTLSSCISGKLICVLHVGNCLY